MAGFPVTADIVLSPMRTLVLSDLHLGARLAHDVLRRPEALARLLAAVDDVQRLVLLGDTVELMEGRSQQAMSEAEPILRALGRRLGPGREVILVPGNHDRPLISPWLREHGAELTVSTQLPADASLVLSRVVSWLSPARVSVRYPGVWLSDRVWATHGHYLDRHLMPESAVGITRGLLGGAPRQTAVPVDYERTRRPSLGGTARWLPRPLAALLDDLAELVRASTMPRVSRTLLNRRISPLTSALLGLQMRRASIPALARVAQRLSVDADWVIFGHVHRLGPLPGDDAEQWRGRGPGAPQILNTGSWLYEPLLVHHATPPHPYWPGGAVVVEDGREPRATGLLDELTANQLH